MAFFGSRLWKTTTMWPNVPHPSSVQPLTAPDLGGEGGFVMRRDLLSGSPLTRFRSENTDHSQPTCLAAAFEPDLPKRPLEGR